MLSATAITSNAPITLALGLFAVKRPKIIPKLVTVEDVAPKLNLLGSLGNFKKISLILRRNNPSNCACRSNI